MSAGPPREKYIKTSTIFLTFMCLAYALGLGLRLRIYQKKFNLYREKGPVVLDRTGPGKYFPRLDNKKPLFFRKKQYCSQCNRLGAICNMLFQLGLDCAAMFTKHCALCSNFYDSHIIISKWTNGISDICTTQTSWSWVIILLLSSLKWWIAQHSIIL